MPTPAGNSSASVRYALIVLAAGGFVSSTSMRVAEPLLPDIATQFNTTLVDAATLITTFVFAYGLCVKVLVSRLGIERMVVLGGFSLLPEFISLALMSDWHAAAVLLIFILGFGLYLIHNTLQTLASEMAPATRGSAIAVFAFSLFTGQVIGVMVDGLLVDGFGYQPMFIVSGTGLLLLAVFLARNTLTPLGNVG